MDSRFPILFVILLILPYEANSQEIRKDDRLREIIYMSGQADVTVIFTGRNEANYLSRHLSVTALKNKQLYISLSARDLDWFLDQKIDYQIIESKGDKGLITASNTSQAMEWDSYPTYTQYDSIMRSFASQYPSLCRLDTIGKSINNKLVLAVKLSDNVSTNENEPEVFYTSTMHGDETGGFILMLRLIDYLLKNYNTSPNIKNLVDNLEIWINPLANPDGTYRSGNTISSPIRRNAEGYDLNRSFPDPLDREIIVPKENSDMIKFMRKHNFVLSANFHGGAEVVNYPWDRWYSKYHADDQWFLEISRAYADTVHKYSSTGYMTDESNGVTRGAEWYVVYGGRQDFVTWELQGREVTIELDNLKTTPAAQLGLLWLYNSRSLLGYLENALYGIYGIVRDSVTYEPVKARVFITGHDKDSSHVYSDTLYGGFTRMLAPGSYNLTFTANGYKDKIVNNVTVFARQKTELPVDLEPDLNYIEISFTDPPVIFPNPASGMIQAILPKGFGGYINVKIAGLSGKILSEFNIFNQEYGHNFIGVNELPSGNYIILFTNNATGARSKGKFIIAK
ncbi:MAG: T9SS type A sorting domain-containing protein [Bacteroidetes bacterium]|nr:T9SS type A sorting domain-containing protein [Bacteroidota bacterium]